jgi:type III secretion system low calcium response chaperone LcrH/SycD
MDDYKDNPVLNAMTSGTPFKYLFPINLDDLMENFYKLASSLYDDGEYEKAKPIFGLLCLLDYTDYRFSMGVGACMQCLKRYEEAILSYIHSVLLNSDDPKAAFHGGECCLAVGNTQQAILFYGYALNSINKDDQSKEMRKQASNILKILKKG